MDAQSVQQVVTEGLTRLKTAMEQEYVVPHHQRLILAEQEIVSVKGSIDAEVTSMKSTIDAGMLSMKAESTSETESMKGIIEKEIDSVKQRVQDWEGKQNAIKKGMEEYVVKTR